MTKEIYFYWGNQSMSFLRYMTLKSFNVLNPDWGINLVVNSSPAENKWTSPEEQDNVNYQGYDYRKDFDSITNLNIIDLDEVFPMSYVGMSNVHIKDMLNWYLLSTRSCFVADMDIIFSKPMSMGDGIDKNANVNICNYDFFNNYIPVSFMGSIINEHGVNPFYDEVYKNSIIRYNPKSYESCGNVSIPYKSIYEIIDRFKDLKIHKMEEETVFPFVKIDITNAGKLCWKENNEHPLKSNTIGIHWYGGQPVSQKYNNLITKENYNSYNNVITEIIKKLK